MNENEEISLLIDIGTNGEIVLGNRYNRIHALPPPGLAFEGTVNIRNGQEESAGPLIGFISATS